MRVRCLLAIIFFIASVACGGGSKQATGPSPTATPDRELVPAEWFLRSISKDERTVKITYTITGVASGCQRGAGAASSATNELVNLTAYRSVARDKNLPCTEELGYVDESVKLGDPLGKRALVGCRPPKNDASEDKVCRSLERSRKAGVLDR